MSTVVTYNDTKKPKISPARVPKIGRQDRPVWRLRGLLAIGLGPAYRLPRLP